jgi:hypothetical protein
MEVLFTFVLYKTHPMRRKNDILWKGVIEEVFDDLLRFLFAEADEIFDMERGFEFLDKELAQMYPEPGKGSDTRFVDKLVKIYRRNGFEEWLLVHLEVQGHADKQFSERMFKYYYRIYDRHEKPVTAIAIFTGHDGKDMPGSYEYIFLGTHLIYKYNTLCVVDSLQLELENKNNPFAVVMLAAKKALLAGKIPEKELLKQKLMVAKLLIGKNRFPRTKIEGVLSFLNNYIQFEDQQTNRIFEKELDKINHKINTMGVVERLAEFKAEEARENEREKFIKKLLADTEFSVEKIASLTDVTPSFVEEIKESLTSK